MTVTRVTETVDIVYPDVKMCVITDGGLCQIMREADGTQHLDTFTTNLAVTVYKSADT